MKKSDFSLCGSGGFTPTPHLVVRPLNEPLIFLCVFPLPYGKDVEKSLNLKCLARTYKKKTGHTT